METANVTAHQEHMKILILAHVSNNSSANQLPQLFQAANAMKLTTPKPVNAEDVKMVQPVTVTNVTFQEPVIVNITNIMVKILTSSNAINAQSAHKVPKLTNTVMGAILLPQLQSLLNHNHNVLGVKLSMMSTRTLVKHVL